MNPADVTQGYIDMLGTYPMDMSFAGAQYWINQPNATKRDMYYAGMLHMQDLLNAAPPTPTPTPTPSPVWNRGNINYPLDFSTASGKNNNVSLGIGQTLSFQITTAEAGWVGNFMTEMNTMGQNCDKFMNVSTVMADFSYDNLDAQNGWADSGMQFQKVSYQILATDDTTTPRLPFYAQLLPYTTYYINIRDEKASGEPRNPAQRGVDSLAVYGQGAISGFVFQMQRHLPDGSQLS